MKQNKDEFFNIGSNSPLFSSLIGISAALFLADTLVRGALLCAFTLVVAVCLSALASVVNKKLNEDLSFWSVVLLGVVLSLPLTLAVNTIVESEKAIFFATIGAVLGFAEAKKEKRDSLTAEIKDSLFFSLMFSVGVVSFAFFRELLAKGSILGAKLFDGIEFFGTFYGSIFIFVAVAMVYRAIEALITKGRDVE